LLVSQNPWAPKATSCPSPNSGWMDMVPR
jgi:hypothetical protein